VKFAGPEYVKHLHQLIVKIWITETIPEEWYLSIVCLIHKKGVVMVCSNYRRISLLCISFKIFPNILFNRLSPCAEGIIGDYQCGFRQGRSICHQIFTIHQILEQSNEFQIETHNLFIDFRSAYDAIDRDNLYRAMEEMHIPRKLIALVRATMRKTRCQIKIQNKLSSPIITRNGVRQGDSLACLLFNITLEKVVRDAGINTRGTIFYK
jgi:sorting nexin-29